MYGFFNPKATWNMDKFEEMASNVPYNAHPQCLTIPIPSVSHLQIPMAWKAGSGHSGPMPTEPSRIFPQTKNEDFRRQFSLAADERVINKLGTKMKFSEGAELAFLLKAKKNSHLTTTPP